MTWLRETELVERGAQPRGREGGGEAVAGGAVVW